MKRRAMHGELSRVRDGATAPGPRRGITLLEVLLAGVILAGALATLGQLVSNGVHAGVRSDGQTEAAARCRSKLDEFAAGIEPVRSVPDTPYPDDRRWTWQAEADMADEHLQRITVTVRRGTGRDAAAFSLTLLLRPRTGAGGAP